MTTLNLTDHHAEAYRDACADRGKIAFVAIMPDEPFPGIQGALGVAVANERGYFPVPLGWARYATYDAAADHADRLNTQVLGLTTADAFRIIASTMGGMRYTPEAA
jgi:hypothetical protein